MSTIDISKLDYQVDALLDTLERLRHENASLQAKITNLIKDKDQNSKKTKRALSKLKKLLSDLKGQLT